MKLSVFKKVCLTVMGVGVVGSLVSVGTFATFTATTTNPGNTFSAGTLQITTSGTAGTTLAQAGSVGTGLQGPNVITGGASVAFGGAECTKVTASACTTLIDTSHVTLAPTTGMEPGQYVQGLVKITNAGTLPAAYSVQVQNASLLSGSSNSGTTNALCPSDIGSAPANAGGAACVKLGDAVNVTLEDITGSPTVLPIVPGSGAQCIYGKGYAGAGNSPSAPATGLAAAGGCDNIVTNVATAGLKLVTGNVASAAGDPFTDFATKLAGGVYIPGSASGIDFTAPGGAVKRWNAGETRTFLVTLAFPDRGVTTGALGSDTVTVGYDNIYQGGSLSFDLLWFAQQ